MTAPDIPALLAQAAHIWDTAGPPPNEDTTWADTWAEQAADERHINFDPRADDRAADSYYEKRFSA
jgi:hypothetical protein